MDLIYRNECFRIKKACIEVRKNLGNGFLEKVYEESLKIELSNMGFNVDTQKKLEVKYKGQVVGDYYADIVVNDVIIIELKCVSKIHPIHKAQLLNYLKATGFLLGLLINFPNDSRGFSIERVPNLISSGQDEQKRILISSEQDEQGNKN